MASSWLLEPVAGQAAAGRSLVPAAFRNGWLASAVLQGGATKVPPPNLVLHLPRCPSTPVGVASGAGPSHGDGWPAPGHPIPTRRPAGHPGWIVVVPTPWRRAAPAGGAKRGTARALHAITSWRFKQERLSSSTGYSGAHRPPAAALGGQPSASSRSGTLPGWTPGRGLVPQPGTCQPVPWPQAAGKKCPAAWPAGPSGNPRFSDGAAGWASWCAPGRASWPAHRRTQAG
jgi:hypothetical protein